ncbi:hypothetical protein Gorai_014710, partial [Gossypium raimondii]|nr:hypothetical protein [Gossypium raimondii]
MEFTVVSNCGQWILTHQDHSHAVCWPGFTFQKNRLPLKCLLMADSNMWNLRHYPMYVSRVSSHGGEEIPKSSLSSETASAKKRDALPTIGEAFGPWMLFSIDSEYLTSELEAPFKVLGTTRFIQGDFIKNLKGKEIEKGSGSMVVVNLGKGLSGCVDDCGPSIKSRPYSTLGLRQKCNGSPLECFGLQPIAGQISNSYNLGLEGATGIKNKDPTILISFSNDKATSLHSNPTFEKHPKAKVGLISNALNPKKHIVITFQEKLDNKSKPKMHANPSNIPKGHGAESRKGNGHSRKSLFKSIREREGNSNL